MGDSAGTGTNSDVKRASFANLVVALCALLALLVVGLMIQNRELRAAIRPARPRHPAVGEHVSTIATELVAGAAKVADALRFDDGRLATLVLFEHAECQACADTRADFAKLLRDLRASGAVIVAIELGDAPREADPKLDPPAYRAIGDVGWIARVDETPSILTVDRAGMIRGEWWGLLDDVGWRQVQVTITALNDERAH